VLTRGFAASIAVSFRWSIECFRQGKNRTHKKIQHLAFFAFAIGKLRIDGKLSRSGQSASDRAKNRTHKKIQHLAFFAFAIGKLRIDGKLSRSGQSASDRAKNRTYKKTEHLVFFAFAIAAIPND
jgi:hypothetical protein